MLFKMVQTENIIKKEVFPYSGNCLKGKTRATNVDNKRTRTEKYKARVNKISAIAPLCSIT